MEPDEARIAAAVRLAFGETADPARHVRLAAGEALLDALVAWALRDGPGSTIAALVAPPGFGKTHLLRVLEKRFEWEPTPAAQAPSRFTRDRVVYLPYASLSLLDLCDWVAGLLSSGSHRESAREGRRGEADGATALAALLERARHETGPLLLLIDDADSMPEATLRGLVQALARSRSPLRFVLALNDDSRSARMLAALDPLDPFEQFLRTPLDEQETEAYLRARLAGAGLDAELLDGLDPTTVGRIRALSGGVPRRIHRVVSALLEPDRAPLARALSIHRRQDAWLGAPIVDAL